MFELDLESSELETFVGLVLESSALFLVLEF